MNERPTHIDLFSGIGGFAIAAQWAGFQTVAFCEIDAYCQAILKERFGAVMADAASQQDNREWRHNKKGRDRVGRRQQTVQCNDRAPDNDGSGRCGPTLHSDIRTLDGTRYRGADLLTGGFPCQPFSVAGKRAGAADDRFLWPEMLRVIDEARPAWVLGENVAGIVPMELDRVLSDLESLGYSCWPLVIPACAVDAKHRRDRVWIVAHSGSRGWEAWGTGRRGKIEAGARNELGQSRQDAVALARGISKGLEEQQRKPGNNGRQQPAVERSGDEWARWLPEPDVGRVAHGVSARVDRLKALGNSIVPQVAFEILSAIRTLI